MNAKKDHIFHQMHLLIFFEHLQEREAIPLLTPLSSSPQKEARCPSTVLGNTYLFFTHYFLNSDTFYCMFIHFFCVGTKCEQEGI